MAEKFLVCRRCRCAPDLVKESGKPDMIRCPQCGASGVFRTVLDQATKFESGKMVDDFSKQMERSMRGLKNVSYKRGRRSRGAPSPFIFK